MDEYTFLLVAKLKADRLKLEREAAAARRATLPQPERSEIRNSRPKYSPRAAPLRFLAWR
jgi:hypothetical protein